MSPSAETALSEAYWYQFGSDRVTAGPQTPARPTSTVAPDAPPMAAPPVQTSEIVTRNLLNSENLRTYGDTANSPVYSVNTLGSTIAMILTYEY